MTDLAGGRSVASPPPSGDLASDRPWWRRSSARRHAAVAAVGACALVVAVAYDPAALAGDPKRVALVAAALAATAFASREGARRRVPAAWWAAAAFLALSAASAIYGVPSGLLDLGTWLGAAALAAAVARAGAARARRAAIVAAACIGGVTGLWAVADALRGVSGFALHAGQGNPNTLGLVACAALPLLLDAASSRHAPWRARIVFAAASAAAIGALSLAHSRTALVAAAAASTWLLVAKASSRVARLAPVGGAVAAAAASGLVALALVAQLVGSEPASAAGPHRESRAPSGAPTAAGRSANHDPPTDEPRLDRTRVGDVGSGTLAARDVGAGRSLLGRRWIWARALEAARDAAPLGAGLGDFSRPWLASQGRALADLPRADAALRFVHAGHAHDELLHVAVESGPLAAVSLAAALVLSFFAHARARFLGGAAALLAVAVAMLGDVPLRSPPVAMLVALVIAAERRPLSLGDARSRAGVWARGGPAATLAVSVGLSGLLFVATRSWIGARIRTSADELDPLARVAALGRSRRIDPGSADAAAALGIAELATGHPAQALVALRDAERLDADVATNVAIGEAHRALGDPARALAAYAKALALAPGSFRALSGFARASRDAGAFDDAERAARAAVGLAPGSAAARGLLNEVLRSRFDAEADDR